MRGFDPAHDALVRDFERIVRALSEGTALGSPLNNAEVHRQGSGRC